MALPAYSDWSVDEESYIMEKLYILRHSCLEF